METIVNRVANSGLITLHLEEILETQKFIKVDLRPILWQGLVLREKDLKEFLMQEVLEEWKDAVVWIDSPEDVILPQWTLLMMQAKWWNHVKLVAAGPLENAQDAFLRNWINQLNESEYKDQRVIIKGFTDQRITLQLQMALAQKLLPWVKSLMFGEPCSTVPLYKRP
ncbi:MAG: hypothetical protein RL062_478 [Bacteroidota bacterium]